MLPSRVHARPATQSVGQVRNPTREEQRKPLGDQHLQLRHENHHITRDTTRNRFGLLFVCIH